MVLQQYQRIFVAACAPTVLRQSCTCLSLDVLSVRRMRAQQGFHGIMAAQSRRGKVELFPRFPDGNVQLMMSVTKRLRDLLLCSHRAHFGRLARSMDDWQRHEVSRSRCVSK